MRRAVHASLFTTKQQTRIGSKYLCTGSANRPVASLRSTIEKKNHRWLRIYGIE